MGSVGHSAHPCVQAGRPFNRGRFQLYGLLWCVCSVGVVPEDSKPPSLSDFSQIPGFPLPHTDCEAVCKTSLTLGLSRLHKSRACIRLE